MPHRLCTSACKVQPSSRTNEKYAFELRKILSYLIHSTQIHCVPADHELDLGAVGGLSKSHEVIGLTVLTLWCRRQIIKE